MPEASILVLLLALSALASDPADLAHQAWEQLRMGRAQQALDMTAGSYQTDPAVAAVHIAASQRVHHPLKTAELCRTALPRLASLPTTSSELLRTCAWQLVNTRTAKNLAVNTAQVLSQRDPYDHDARGLLHAAQSMDQLPTRKWKPPVPGQMRERRERDLRYLWRYLRPEDGTVTATSSFAVLPKQEGGQLRAGVHSQLYLRGHEVVPAGWRLIQRVSPTDPDEARQTAHQLHGGYYVDIVRKTPLMLDASVILGEGRDEGVVRFRADRRGLGVWSADTAMVWTPWGRHGALKLGWFLTFEGLGTMDLRAEGQLGQGGPRGLVSLGLLRSFGRVTLRLDGQIGQATRPLGDRYIIRDLPGLEGAAGSLSIEGPLSDRFRVLGKLEIVQLHPDLWESGDVTGLAGLHLTGRW